MGCGYAKIRLRVRAGAPGHRLSFVPAAAQPALRGLHRRPAGGRPRPPLRGPGPRVRGAGRWALAAVQDAADRSAQLARPLEAVTDAIVRQQEARGAAEAAAGARSLRPPETGRASCRERVVIS